MLPASTLLLGALLFAQERPDTVPLFASAEPLELTVVADLEAIRKDRSEDPEDRPALVVLATGTRSRPSSVRGATSGGIRPTAPSRPCAWT